MANETPKEKKLLDEMKGAEKKGLEVEKELDEKDLDTVSGGCMCKCGLSYDCGGGGGGEAL